MMQVGQNLIYQRLETLFAPHFVATLRLAYQQRFSEPRTAAKAGIRGRAARAGRDRGISAGSNWRANFSDFIGMLRSG